MLIKKFNVLLTTLIEPIGNKYLTTSSVLSSLNATNNSSKASGPPTGSNKPSDSKPNSHKNKRLFASVCIERLPVITSDMNDLEKRYSNLINEINIRKSYLSNHELRHLQDLERAAKKKTSDETGESEMVIETALDYEDRCLKDFQKLKFSERKLSTDFDAKVKGQNKESIKSIFQNVDYILDKKLILLINDTRTSTWQLPYVELAATDTSLRQAAERSVTDLNAKFVVDFMGNAPVGVYKENSDPNLTNKYYFFKAQYKSGAQLLALSKLDFVWIRKDELKDFIKNEDYLECLNNFILDF